MFRLILTERARPGCLLVNGQGRRFVDEAQNYNDLGRDAAELRADVVLVPERAGLARLRRQVSRDVPARAPRRAAIPIPTGSRGARRRRSSPPRSAFPADELTATISRFNEGARDGADPDFGRGSYPYDRFIGDLGPLEQAPYYAFKVLPGCLGTKGGPRTDAHGRVLSITDGNPIPGLYAAGNAAASPFGLAYPGAGGTIGPAVVFGLRAGDAAAGD